MTFLTDNFLLHNSPAQTLYHEFAKDQPIFDYHCHLSPKIIAENQPFENLYDIWLNGDHYKWRAMRTLGVDEALITGDAKPREKFQAFAECVPHLIGNPLYHWTHLELKRPFGITGTLLSGKTAESIWQRTNELLQTPPFTPRGTLAQMNVRMVGTTDDPCDDLQHHATIAASSHATQVLPTFRPDRAINIDKPEFPDYLAKLSQTSGLAINHFESLCLALSQRLDYFKKLGCVASDHGLEIVRFAPIPDNKQLDAILKKRLNQALLSEHEIAAYQTALLSFLGQAYHQRKIVMQLHIGPIRNNSTRGFDAIGADAGYDSIGDQCFAAPLSAILDTLDRNNTLPKTILYNINPRDNEMLCTMAGNFQEAGIKGKVQFGSGWWHNDQKTGMEKHLITHAQMGVLSVFVGMLTDSRSFLSFTRHEYFRRILCNLIGKWVTDGEIPNDMAQLGLMVKNICYHNAADYFSQNNDD